MAQVPAILIEASVDAIITAATTRFIAEDETSIATSLGFAIGCLARGSSDPQMFCSTVYSAAAGILDGSLLTAKEPPPP